MRNLFSVIILMIGLMITLPSTSSGSSLPNTDRTSFVVDNQSTAPTVSVQEEGGVGSTGSPALEAPLADPSVDGVESNFLKDNWIALVFGLFGFADVVTRLTPTEKDNSILNWLFTLFNALIPNLKKGGGSFKLLSK